MKTYINKNLWAPEEHICPEKLDYKKSATVPDESYTIAQMMERVQKGMPLQANSKSPIFMETEDLDSPDMEELNRMDMVDADEIVSEIAERGAHAQNQIRDHQRKQKEEKAKRVAAKREQMLGELANKISDKGDKS